MVILVKLIHKHLKNFNYIVVKALWNALRGRHKYGAMNGNQYAARRCSMITRLTRNSLTRVRVRWGAAIFAHYTINSFYYIIIVSNYEYIK